MRLADSSSPVRCRVGSSEKSPIATIAPIIVRCRVGSSEKAAEVAELLHGKEKTVYADAGYIGAEKRAPKRGRKWYVAAKRGKIKAMPEGELKEATKHLEYIKAAVRSKVEHPFRVIKRQFGYQKVRFKGLAKNTAQIQTLFALGNLWMMRRTLLTLAGEVHP
jgi:IS5 family transposase